ncbi:MAG: hypothetical protein ACNI3H_05645 [Halarcobacter ebronensis]|uniref:hypothetical protein n=1 Tax=Halarcobacter ebronensis TaxID=1462615 RepID=UPI003C726A6E
MDLVNSNNGEVVITLKEITDLIKVQHSKAMKKVEKLAEEPSFGGLAKMDTPTYNPDGSINKMIETYVLNKKQAIAVGAKLNNKLLMKVIDRLEELEKAKSQPRELTRTELALMVIEAEKERERLQLENKELERTKAYISDKKTATAMATASAKSRENEKLKQQLDESLKYSTIRKQEARLGLKFPWRPLKKASEELGLKIKKIYDPLFERDLNSYHADAWLKAYGVDITKEY